MVSIVPLCGTDPLMKSPFAPQGGGGKLYSVSQKNCLFICVFVYLFLTDLVIAAVLLPLLWFLSMEF